METVTGRMWREEYGNRAKTGCVVDGSWDAALHIVVRIGWSANALEDHQPLSIMFLYRGFRDQWESEW